MKVLILQGSPRKDGNTAAFLIPFTEELRAAEEHIDIETVRLYEKEIKPCVACNCCQNTVHGFGCPQKDHMAGLFDKIIQADALVLASPIYIWFCTGPMKLLLDRFGYAVNKYYGTAPRESLAAGKKCALLLTCGYPPKNVTYLFEDSVKFLCKHSKMEYLGMAAARDLGKGVAATAEEEASARTLAHRILQSER